jgi:hypothetical protein
LLEILLIFLAVQSLFKAREIHRKEVEAILLASQPGLLAGTNEKLSPNVNNSGFGFENQDEHNYVTINGISIPYTDDPQTNAEIL